MRIKLWHLAALAAGGYYLFKDDITAKLSPGTVRQLQAGVTYILHGSDVNNPVIRRFALLTPTSDRIVQFGVTRMNDATGAEFIVTSFASGG